MEEGQEGTSKGNAEVQDSFKILIRHARQKISWKKSEKGPRVSRKIKRMSEISKLPAPFTMTQRDGKIFLRSVALLTVFFFSWNQLGFSDGTILLDYDAPFQSYVPSTGGENSDSVSDGSLPDRRFNEDFGADSLSFISGNSPLSAPDSSKTDEATQDTGARSSEAPQVMAARVDEWTLVRRDVSLELREVSTNTVEAVSRRYGRDAYGNPVYQTSYGYRGGLFMQKTGTTSVQNTFRGFMEVDLSALYAGGIDPEQISRVELVFDAISSQSGSYSFSIYDMTANEDGLFPAGGTSAENHYSGTSSPVQSVKKKTFTRNVSQRNTVDVTESVLRDLRGGKMWTGFFATPDSAMSKIQLSNVRLKVTYEKLVPPVTGTIAINAGADYTLSPTVNLDLFATDNGSGMGVGGMSFSNDNINWTSITPYAKSQTYELPSGDGEKMVYVRYYDEAGNVSEIYSASIILDTRRPKGSIAVNGGTGCVNKTSVTLNLSAQDEGSGVWKMCFSSNGMTWTEAEDYAPTKEWTFSAGDGYKKVYVKYQDKSGRWSIASWVRVRLDTQIPTGSVNINAGVMYASSSKVKLHFKGSDKGSGMSGVSLSFDGTNWEAPIRFTSSTYVVLPDGDGVKTVYAKFYDKAGNVSPVYSDSIILDTLPPTGTVKVNGGVQFINQPTVTLNLNAVDEGSGLSKISFSNDGITWVMEASYSETKRWTFSSGDGVKKVYVKFQDNRGRWSPVTSVTVTLDTVAPSGSMTINGGAAYTNSREVMLNLSGTDNVSGIAGMSFSTGDQRWTPPEAFTASRAFTLPDGDGNKTIFVRFYDKAGNVSAVFSKSIKLSAAAPVIVIAPETPTLINQKALTINYTLDGVAKQKTFTNLVEGENVLTITETNQNGKQTTVSHGVTVDTIPPAIVVDAGIPSLINMKTLSVSYTVDGVIKQKTFTDLVEGANALIITETDLAGNPTTITLSVFVDREAPSGSALINDGASYTNESEVKVTVNALDNFSSPKRVEVSFSQDGVHFASEAFHAPTDGSSPFYLVTLNGADGEKTLFIRLRDEAGNVTTFSQKIILERTPPQGSISLDGYPSNNYFYDFPVALKLNATDAGSGVSLMRFSLDGGARWTDWENYKTSRTISLQEAIGLYDYDDDDPVVFSVEYKDLAGNVGAESFTSTRDGELPQGTITINGGTKYTNNREVTLALTAHDAISGVRGIQIQVLNQDGSYYSDTGLIPFELSKTVVLPPGDGEKTVLYEICDWAACYTMSSAIILETMMPVISAVDASGITSSGATITWTTNEASDTQIEYGLTTSYGSSTTLNPALVTSHSQILSSLAAGALYHYRVKSKDAAGNLRTSADFTFTTRTVHVDPPAVAALAQYTNQTSYTLSGTKPANTSIWVNGVQKVARDALTTWSYVETLSGGDGLKSFAVSAKDSVGTQSAIVNVSTTLDTTAPTGSVKVNGDRTYTNSSAVTLTLTGTDATSGVDQMRFSTDSGASWSNWETFSGTKTLTLPAGDGTKTVHYQLKDKAGLVSVDLTDQIILDTTSPLGSIEINAGASHVSSPVVTLSLSGTDNTSGIAGMSFSTNGSAWSAAEAYQTTKSCVLPSGDGQKTVYVRYYDAAGNVSKAYSKSIILDTTPPAVVIDVETPGLINVKTMVIHYTSDGIAKSKTFTDLVEGENTLSIIETDSAGNQTTAIWQVVVDTVAPSGTVVLNDGELETGSCSVTVHVNVTDDRALKDIRFSTDGGVTWSEWESRAFVKTMTLPEGEGEKEVLCQARDEAGNVADFKGTIYYVVTPQVRFLSDTVVTDPLYTLRYMVNDKEREETWSLQPGENRLIVKAGSGSSPSFFEYTVTLDRTEDLLPPMPEVPILSDDLVSMTAVNGLILKYSRGELVAIEKPGAYTLYPTEFDSQNELVDGLLVFNDGGKLLYENGKASYRLSEIGELTTYNADGTVASVTLAGGKKVRFAYRHGDTGEILSIISYDEDATGFYGSDSKPFWVKKNDGTVMTYHKGFLKSYQDPEGNVFHYQVSSLYESEQLTGYRSDLAFVSEAGEGELIPLEAVLVNPDDYVSIRATLENDLSLTMEYDADGVMKKVVSGSGEALELQKGLPVSFTNRSGETLTVRTDLSENQELLSISLEGSDIRQEYDGDGNLTGIRLNDGTTFKIRELGLDRIVLEDGSDLSELVWNGSRLTGFRKTDPDGRLEIYQNSRMTQRVEPDGGQTSFVDNFGAREPEEILTSDGRTYQVIRFPNAEGLTQRLAQLKSVDLPDGTRIEIENGKPVRYIQARQVQIEAFEVPELLAGESFVPLIELPDARLRSLTVNADGFIYSGEILFNDGTQYLIENNKIAKQIASDGQFVEFSEEITSAPSQPNVPPEPLTEPEIDYRNHLIEAQMRYFVDGIGIHTATGFPVDNYQGESDQPSDYSQSTLIGFWAEILAAIATGDYQTSGMTQAQAFERLDQLLVNYREVQKQVGWNGMVAFFKIVETEEPVLDALGEPTGETRNVIHYQNCFNQYGFGDSVNLSVSLASVIGALQGKSWEPENAAICARILSSANEILEAQEPGYAAFYDPVKKRFRGAYAQDSATGTWSFVKDYYIDRVFNEFRSGVVWVAAKYPQYQQAFENLDVTLRDYRAGDGTQTEIAAPFDGGAFQMFWPLIHVDETRYPEFETALRNFLHAQADFTSRNGIPGLISAGDCPGSGYEGKIGLPSAAEGDDLKFNDIGSLYGTASAFGVAPHYTLQFLKNIETAFPEILTSAGFVDAIRMQTVTSTDPVTGETTTKEAPVFSTQYFGVDQASFILSLLKTSQKYFDQYLDQEGIRREFDGLYESIQLNLKPANSGGPSSLPEWGDALTRLYDGDSTTPDGFSAPLVREASFVPAIFDPELGSGRIFNYRQGNGAFHHSEIEFGEGPGARIMGIQEYLLLPGRADAGRALLGGYQPDLYNKSDASGVFYTPDQGYAESMLTRDPELGEVRRVIFDFRQPAHAVGLWNDYRTNQIDLGQFDFLSIPVRVEDDTPENLRLKFELKGTGNIFVTDTLRHGWQYITIPVVKPVTGKVYEIATVIQSVDGQPVKGGLYLGPLSGFRVRTSNELDWSVMLGKTASEMQTLIRSKIAAQAFGAGLTTAEEILEDFTLDSKGNLIDGTLRRADGGIQYFRDGLMTKWVFRNGRTVLYENGIANFIVDLSRGRLETGRFYYDQDLKGNVHSFNIQDNERKRTFGEDGMLRTLVQDGQFVNFENGKMDSIRTPRGTLTDLEFADDGSLLKAHVVMNDGRVFDIDQTTEQSTDIGNGVTLHYQGSMITAIETSQNGRTDLSYTCDSAGRLAGVDATFTDRGQTRTLSFFEYIQRPERSIEKSYLMGSTFDVFSVAGVGGFSVGTLTNGEFTLGMGGNYGYDSKALYKFRYLSESGRTLGMYMNHANSPLQISDYGFISLTVRQDPSMNWNQDFALKLKSPSCRTLYTFSLDSTVSGDQTFWFPLEGKTGLEGEITLEVIRQKEGVGKIGAVYVKDLSYINIKNLDHPVWENELGILSSQIRNFKIESDNLMNVGARIATKESVRYEALVPYLDTPTRILYTDTRDAENQLVNFTRLDGSQVEIEGEHVSRLIFPDGTVNEYSSNFQNSTQGTIEGPGETPGGVFDYRYGALRRITQADGRQYDLSYEFDVDGQEITVFKDVLSGEERRFRDGKLVSARDGSGLRTDYEYRDGTLIGAEMTYRDRVLNSTRYAYQNEGTQVTDERGTIWFYDTKGTLIKHMTKDGLLYEYSEYVQPLEDGQTVDLRDYKSALYAESGLRAVSLKGYQAPDGSWIIFEGDQGSEVHLVSGATAVNLVFDEDQRIKAGQIQFPDGLILEIEDYVPVRGRLAEGSLFEQSLPQGSAREIVQDEEGGFLGFQCKVGDYTMTYNAAGELVRAETGAGASHYFTYTKDTQGRPTAATETALTQVAFNGVPFPKELELLAGSDQKILDSGKEIARHEGSGFLVGVYKESLNQWDVYSGSFSSQADRTGLEHFLSGVKAGESVAAAVSDPSFSKAGEGILSLFEGLGAGQVRQAASGNRKWTFFGNERLSAGEGRDAIDQASFSTVTKNVMTYSIDSDSHPTFRDAPMLLDFEMSVSRAYDSFLKEYQPLKLDRDLQRMTVYDAKNEMIYTQRLDGLSSFYEFGKVRETFDKEGNLLSLHEYGCLSGAGAVPPCQNSEDMTLSRITLVKARQDLETEVQNAAEKIAQARFDALYKLAWQDDVARLQIKESVNAGVAEINRQISSLESQRYQTVKKCRRYVFVKHCEEHTYEVPGVQSAINGLVSQRADLIRTGEEQLAAIPGAMAEKQLEIEQATAEKIAELEAQRKSVILDLLHQEMEPILTDFYRRILGRDASEEEFDDWVDRFKGTEAIDISALETELSASPERAAREAEKALIIQGVRDFLNNYLASSVEERVLMLQELRLEAPEVVDLASSDADAILAWLKSRDLHFGQSAFLSLKKMLASSGAEVSMTTLGRESILIDILTGTIHKFTEGDLLISMFALDRTALIHARDFAAVRYSFEDLKDLYQSACGSQAPACGVRVIAHIGEDHFVLVKNVTETEVTYEETGKGIGGSDVTVTREQFLSVWNTKGNTGYLLVEASQAIPEKRLSDREAMRVRGAFFAIFFFVASIVLTAVSVAVSFFSPTMGKILGYAALVAGIIGIVASLGQLVVQGLRMAFSNVTANGLFSTMAQGIMNLGKVIWESVKSVGRFVLKGFQFLKGGFTGGFGSFGAGITNMRSFLFDGARVLADGTREFTFSQIAARQLVAAGLTSGVSIGLEGLGIDSRVAGLAGVFAGGGFLGIGTSVSGFLKSGLQQLVLQGVSEMAVHVGLPPPLASALSLIATQSLNSFFDPGLTLKAGLLQIAPDVATQLTLGGLELLGRSIGLDPRITALMGLPVAAAVGGVTKDLLNPNGSNPGRIFDTIKDSIFSTKTLNGMISIGTSLAVDQLGLPPIASDLISGFITGFSQTKSGEKVFSKIGEGISRFTGWITDGIRPVVDFGAKILNGAVEITEAGFKSAINAFGSFFSRPTQEYIYQDVAGIRSGSVSVDGDIWTWQSGDSRIDYNVRTGRVDETFGIGGTAKIEGLGQDALGNFYYSKLSSATAFDGGVLSQSYESGKLTEWGLLFPDGTSIVSRACNVNGWDFSGGVFNGNVENGEIIYYVPAPDLDANPTTHPARHATYTFYVQNGNVLPNVDARIVSGSGSQDTSDLVASMKPFYLLANGINNTENYQGSQNLIADYYRKLESDLVAKSSGTVTASDIVIPPLYPQVLHNWFSGLRTFANRTFDVLKVIAEGQLPQWHLAVVQSLMDGIRNFYNDRACAGENARTRPVVAVGYSGGMAPLLETISTLNIQTAAIIGAGTAIADITEIRETLETLIDTLEYVQKKVFSPVRGLLEMIFGNTVGKIPYVGDGINNTLEAFLGKIDELVQLAATPGVVLTDLIGTMIEEAVGRALDALRIQGRLRDLETIGLAQINSPGAVMMNVYGDRDLLKELNVGGYRDQIGSFTTALPTSNLINIEVVSYTGSSGKTAVADHYIYFGDTRNYDEIEDPEQRALQREYDGLVNDFMVELILASDSDVDRSKFLDRYESCLVQVSPGYYKYFPLGKA